MRHMWHTRLIDTYFGNDAYKEVIAEVDKLYPHDTYVARLLELGSPFVDFSDYENALIVQRLQLFSTRLYWEILSSSQRRVYLQQRGVPPETTWHAYEEILIKNDIVYSLNLRFSDASATGERKQYPLRSPSQALPLQHFSGNTYTGLYLLCSANTCFMGQPLSRQLQR